MLVERDGIPPFLSLKFSLVAIKYFQIGYGPKRKRKLRGGGGKVEPRNKG